MSNPTYNKHGKVTSNGKTPTPSRVDPKHADLIRTQSQNQFVLINGVRVSTYKDPKK